MFPLGEDSIGILIKFWIERLYIQHKLYIALQLSALPASSPGLYNLLQPLNLPQGRI